jgi:hypothetical protein
MARQGYNEDFVAPGRLGLWSTAKRQILSREYCTVADNLRLSTSGALALRNGYSDQTTTELSSDNVESLHEYYQADETVEMIVAWDGGIANDIDDPAGNDISGSVTDSNGTWFFQNFNDKCIGFQEGQKLIVYNGAGNFATVSESSGTAPSGGVGCAAYGRIWQVDSDGVTIKYSGLLDETDWGGSGAGQLGLNNVWTEGQDTITAIKAFNGALIIFGKKHVVIYADAQGSEIGLDPDNLYLVDIIAGTGCVSQWTVQNIGEQDILFCSKRGVQSLRRLIQEKSNPIETLTFKVEQDLIDDIKSTLVSDQTSIRSVYSEEEGFYLLTFPTRSTTWCLETRRTYTDELGGQRVPVFKWDLAPYSWAHRDNGDLLLGVTDKIGLYENFQDDGTAISWEWNSPWLDYGEELNNRLKMLKRISLIVETQWGGNIVARWGVDFQPFSANRSTNLTTEDLSNGAEWGVGEWGLAEWGGSIALQDVEKPGRHTGQYYKFSLAATSDKALTLQKFKQFYKLGRVA